MAAGRERSYLRVGDKRARLNRRLRVSGTAGGENERERREGCSESNAEGRDTEVGQRGRRAERKRKKRSAGRRRAEKGALERRYRYGIMKTRMYF